MNGQMSMSEKEMPIVLKYDDGIRPAGSPIKCFYCKSAIGEPHKRDCVCVVKKVKFSVWREDEHVATYITDEPYHWGVERSELHKNESSWCSDNAVNDPGFVWDSSAYGEQLKDWLNEDDERCLCGTLRFEFESVVDQGPNRAPA